MENLKNKTINGVTWSFIESASLKVIQFVLNVVLARLLLPEHYGVIAIVMVFITISQIFIDGGFATALIQDKNKTERDYSTVFTFNIAISVVCYLILFVSAPFISKFYNNDITLYLRVESLGLIIYSFAAIPRVRLTVKVDFKSIAKVTLTSALCSGCIGVILAYNGFGVWSLIGQYLSASVITTVLYIVLQRWKPVCFFDVQSFKRLFPFGIRLLASRLVDRIYANLYPIIVGKFYKTNELGFYSRADQFASLPSNTCADMFLRVTYPIMSSLDNDSDFIKIYKKFISLSSFVIFPIMFLLVVIAKPLILILLTEKWSETIILLQILCFGHMYAHILMISRNVLYAKGRADLALRLEIIKKSVATAFLLISVPFGLIGLCVGKVSYDISAVFISSIYTKKITGVSLWSQITDFAPAWIIGFVSAIIAYLPIVFFDNNWVQLIASSVLYILVYVGISYLFKIASFKEVIDLIKERIR